MSKTKFSTKVKALAGIGLIASMGAGAVIGASLFPQTITNVVDLTDDQRIEAFNQGVLSVEPVFINNTIVENRTEIVEVDNGNLDLVLNELLEADGDLSLVTSGLFDDELDLVVERLVQLNDWKAEAQSIALNRFALELDRQHSYDRRDTSKVKIDTDSISVSSVDFKSKDAIVSFEVEFRHDGSLYTADVEVEFYDGKALPIEISNVI